VFDGTGDYVSGTLNNPAGAWVHSSSFWVKLTGTSVDNETIFSIGTDAADKTSTFKFDTSTTLNWFFSGNDTKFNPQAQLNTWEHYVCVYDGGNVASSRRVWKNGVELSINVAANIDYLNLDSYASFRVANRSNLSQPAQCSISNFKIWNVALTAEEVAAEYALGRTGKSINLTDTNLCLGGTVPRAQLDVRGTIRGAAGRFGTNNATIAAYGTTKSVVSIATNVVETSEVIPLSLYRGSRSQTTPALAIAVQDTLSATVGDYWRVIDFSTENTRQCGINLINYNGSGSGQFNIDGRRDTGIGFTVSASDGTNVLENALVVRANGNVGIGTVNPAARLSIKQRDYAWNGGIDIEDADTSNVWHILVSTDDMLYFAYNDSGVRGYLDKAVNVNQIDFTGQHRNFIDGVPYTEYDNLEGLIVSANKNKYYDINEDITTGANAIQISQSLPLVSLSTKEKDKACFGVISGSEDPEKREYEQGTFVSVVQKQKGDRRAFINSVGEGAMWVTDTNGPLESGDYITTSNVAGYGQKQDDGLTQELHGGQNHDGL
jgi:hypothetical protein